MKILEQALNYPSCQEEFVFSIAKLMGPYVEDLDSIEYAFHNVHGNDQVADDIWKLRQRSCEQISTLFKRFSIGIDENRWELEAMSILLPFLQDQFEVRLRLLGVYWELLKAQRFVTGNPDFESFGEVFHRLTALIQECGDMDFGKEEQAKAMNDAKELSPLAA